MQQDSLSLIDAARRLGVHPSTLRRAVLRSEVGHHRIFGRIRFLPADLDRFFASTYQPPEKSAGSLDEHESDQRRAR